MARSYGIDGLYTVADDGCWNWKGFLNRGYGSVYRDGRRWGAHRYSWFLVNGPIPDEMTVDHLCFNPSCVNPEHLRLLTNAENAANRRPMHRRGDHCKHGHEFTPENTRWRVVRGRTVARDCVECRRAECRQRRARNRAEVAA